MRQYHDMLRHILDNGVRKSNRTGTDTISVFGYQTRYDLSEGFPLLTTKKVHLRSVIVELLWFLRGDTNVKYLHDYGVTIWDEWRHPYNLDRNVNWVSPKPAVNKETEYVGDFSCFGLDLGPGMDQRLVETWRRMMRRCYDPTHHRYSCYGAAGVTVHPDWHDPRRFIDEVKLIPQWVYKLNNWNGFHLDKDYFGARQYGPNTSVWLREDENIIYSSTAIPIMATEPSGRRLFFLCLNEASRRLGIPNSSLSRYVGSGQIKTNKWAADKWVGWRFDKYEHPEGKLPRLELIETGDLGPIYGYQWRSWSHPETGTIDQIAWVINRIKTNPDCRRLIVSAWNPAELDQMALAPCHCLFQFNVTNGRLDCQLYQRSADVFLGVPFNIASYALLTMMIAQVTGLKPGVFVHTFGDLHAYVNHLDQIDLQLSREPRPLPKMVIDPTINNIDDFRLEHFTLEGYDPWPTIKAPVAK